MGRAVEEFRRALALAPGSPVDRVNLGLALLRAGKLEEGVAELRSVQRDHPTIPHTWFNLGIVHKREGRLDEARRQFERMTELAPDEPISHYNLGVLYKLANRTDAAARELETAARLDPSLAAPHYQLSGLFRQAGRAADADRHLQTFQEIKKRMEGAAVPEDMEWSVYSEVWEKIDPSASDRSGPVPELRLDVRRVASGVDPATAGLAVLDAVGDGRPDLLVWSRAGVQLLRRGTTLSPDPAWSTFATWSRLPPGTSTTTGLRISSSSRARARRSSGTARGASSACRPALPAGQLRARALVRLRPRLRSRPASARGAVHAAPASRGGEFDDRTARLPLLARPRHRWRFVPLVPDTGATDLVVSYRDRAGVLYRDRLGGRFDATPLEALPAGARGLVARDWDNDGWLDLVATIAGGPLLLANRRGLLERVAAEVAGSGRPAFADLENRGRLDLVVGGSLHRGGGSARPFEPRPVPPGLPRGVVWAESDFDLDGRTDLVAVGTDGNVYLVRNRTATANRWLRVALRGPRTSAWLRAPRSR